MTKNREANVHNPMYTKTISCGILKRKNEYYCIIMYIYEVSYHFDT